MSYFDDYDFYAPRPCPKKAEELAEMRRRANANLMQIKANAPNRPKAAM